jgi:glycosyltransferase involved in cell wall biosynthesis
MRILLSAFACEPYAGSEKSNGWTWAQALARRHDVVVLADLAYRPAVETELRRHPELTRLSFEWVGDGVHHYRHLRRWRYYFRWQRLALRRAATLHAQAPFDVVHHVTFGTLRIPSHLWRLGVPFLWGPIGGGESVPFVYYHPPWMSARQAVQEIARAAWNAWCRRDPRIRRLIRHARVVAVTTTQTLEALPGPVAGEVVTLPSSVLHRADIERVAQRRASPGPPGGARSLFVGRLVGWKGPGLALAAFAAYAADHPDARLDLYGDGPMRTWLERRARVLGVADKVTFKGQVQRERLLDVYADYQIFLFPSMHDSSGFASLEAMAAGLPVVCLDTGGPGAAVPPDAGRKIAVRAPSATVDGLAAALAEFTRADARWRAASDRARAHALDPASTPDIDTMIDRLYGALDGTYQAPSVT